MSVVVNLHTPPERVWGLLTHISPAGIQMRGINVNTFNDWVCAIVKNERNIGPTYLFLPMWRVERMSVDERLGDILSLAEQFRARVGMSLQEYLGWGGPIR